MAETMGKDGLSWTGEMSNGGVVGRLRYDSQPDPLSSMYYVSPAPPGPTGPLVERAYGEMPVLGGFGADIRPKRIGLRRSPTAPLAKEPGWVPTVARRSHLKVVPERGWNPGPFEYAGDGTEDIAGSSLSPKKNMFKFPTHGINSTPGQRYTATDTALYGAGKLGSMYGMHMAQPSYPISPGPAHLCLRSEPDQSKFNPLNTYGSAFTFHKGSSRESSEGVSAFQRKVCYTNGTEPSLVGPSPDKYYPTTYSNGARALGLVPESAPDFRSCAPYSARGNNRYLSKETQVAGLASPGPVYDISKATKLYAAKTFNSSQTEAHQIHWSIRQRGISSFDAIVKRESKQPGPGRYSSTQNERGDCVEMAHVAAKGTGPHRKIMGSEMRCPSGKNIDHSITGWDSPGPSYNPRYGDIGYAIERAASTKQTGFGTSAKHKPVEIGRNWQRPKPQYPRASRSRPASAQQ